MAHRLMAHAVVGVHHANRLAPKAFAEDRCKTCRQGGLENQVFIGIHRALDHGFAKAIGGREQHRITKTGFGVDAEHHPSCRQISTHHALHSDREGHREVVIAVELAVGDSPVSEQRGVTAAAGRQQGRLAVHVEEGFLLTGKAGLGQVFGGSAGAHRHRDGPRCRSRPQLPIRQQDGLLQIRGQWGRQHQGAGGSTSGLKGGDVVAIEAIQTGLQAGQQTRQGQKAPVGPCRGGEALGHAHALGSQRSNHLAKGGVLTPHHANRLETHRLEGEHEVLHQRHRN